MNHAHVSPTFLNVTTNLNLSEFKVYLLLGHNLQKIRKVFLYAQTRFSIIVHEVTDRFYLNVIWKNKSSETEKGNAFGVCSLGLHALEVPSKNLDTKVPGKLLSGRPFYS